MFLNHSSFRKCIRNVSTTIDYHGVQDTVQKIVTKNLKEFCSGLR